MPDQSYPTMLYHPTDATPVMVSTPEELAALGEPWRGVPWSDEEKAAYAAEQARARDEAEAETETPPRSRSHR